MRALVVSTPQNGLAENSINSLGSLEPIIKTVTEGGHSFVYGLGIRYCFPGLRTASGLMPGSILVIQFYLLKLNNSSKNFHLSPRVFCFVCLFVSVASGVLIFQVL